jgi:hypothetical protein
VQFPSRDTRDRHLARRQPDVQTVWRLGARGKLGSSRRARSRRRPKRRSDLAPDRQCGRPARQSDTIGDRFTDREGEGTLQADCRAATQTRSSSASWPTLKASASNTFALKPQGGCSALRGVLACERRRGRCRHLAGRGCRAGRPRNGALANSEFWTTKFLDRHSLAAVRVISC